MGITRKGVIINNCDKDNVLLKLFTSRGLPNNLGSVMPYVKIIHGDIN